MKRIVVQKYTYELRLVKEAIKFGPLNPETVDEVFFTIDPNLAIEVVPEEPETALIISCQNFPGAEYNGVDYKGTDFAADVKRRNPRAVFIAWSELARRAEAVDGGLSKLDGGTVEVVARVLTAEEGDYTPERRRELFPEIDWA